MRRHSFFGIVCILLLFNISVVFSQESGKVLQIGKSKIFIEGTLNEFELNENHTYNSDQWRIARKKVSLLKKEFLDKNGGIFPKAEHPIFDLPVRLKGSLTYPGFYSITAYFDHDTLFPGHLLDYQCDSLTYDLEDGYNHSGTDFFLWPFPWYKMYNDEVEVVAAAPGILYFKQDGNFDQQCELNTNLWNGVALLHEDGSTSWYIHMKKNSLTSKYVGEEIEAGEYLGIVGSSGSSIAPHLHFEVLDAEGNLIDPFYGPCNDLINESWWLDQLPYKDPGINRIATNNHLPLYPECPGEEILNETDVFYPGDSIYLLSYFRNIFTDDQIEVVISRPDNSVFASWMWNSPWKFYSASWLFFLMFLEDDDFGVWNYSITYQGILYEHDFQLLDPQGVNLNSDKNCLEIFPVPSMDFVTINLVINEPFQIVLINSLNMQVYAEQVQNKMGNSIVLDISGFESGIYFVRVNTDTASYLSKIIKL